MKPKQRTELNKELCQLLGIEWRNEEYIQIEPRTWESQSLNPDFTSESGRVQLLKIMVEKRIAFDSWIPAFYMTDDNGSFALAVRDYLRKEK